MGDVRVKGNSFTFINGLVASREATKDDNFAITFQGFS
jgi:hypothetical protein